MNAAKISISLDHDLLQRLDRLVLSHVFSNRRPRPFKRRSKEKIARLQKSRLALECAKLEPLEEQALADTGLAEEAAEWPPY